MAKPPRTVEKIKPETTSTPPVPYLKKGVRLRTRAFFLLGLAVVAWIALGTPTKVDQLTSVTLPTWIVSAVTVVFSVVVAAVESIPGDNRKAALIFWRLRDPLPGSRAFDKANLALDTRIDPNRLKEVMGGKLPRVAKEQNAAWYRMFKAVEQDAAIQAMHFDYLLFRDLAWMSVVLAALAIVLAIVGFAVKVGAPAMLAGATAGFLLSYLLFRQAASERGRRLVNQVLVASTLHHPTKGK